MKRWWHGLTNKGRVLVAVGFTGAMLVVGVPLNVAAVGLADSLPDTSTAAGVADVDDGATTEAASPRATATPKAAPTPTARPTPTPVVTVERVDVSEAVAFDSISVDDPTMDVGSSSITVAGREGTLVRSWDVTYIDGVESARELAGESVTVPPVQQVTNVGSKAPYVAPAPVAAPAPAPVAGGSGCDTNYSGACVPIAPDVDCAGGSGNGPAYTEGPVTVVGSDVYDLDRDGDGIACDK